MQYSLFIMYVYYFNASVQLMLRYPVAVQESFGFRLNSPGIIINDVAKGRYIIYIFIIYIYYKICSFCICDTDKGYVHVSRHSISKAVSVQNLIKPISLPWEKKPYHQMIGSHTHVTHIIPREKKPYHQIIG